ncbi:uncharacterized protein LOC108450877 [Gossypium arboreum]|uniref:uncharacterized protein LOC108450877 n=1 Tax=Gossypium arboreum TaxID=29729 RepID=UPI00081976C1|nr:uncharacterized protein LOC108450877 [Gossypium arboreum]
MIEYHPGKVNVVVDALSRRVMTDMRVMFACLSLYEDGSLLAELQVKPTWIEQIKGKSIEDESLGLCFRQVESGNTVDFGLNSEGVLCFRGKICVSKDTELRQSILREAYISFYAMHPGRNKMYRDLRELYWWTVKIPLWKWEKMTTDFVSVLPLTPIKKDSVWVIVDWLTKSAHFIPVHIDYSLQKLAKLYVSGTVRLNGMVNLRGYSNTGRYVEDLCH